MKMDMKNKYPGFAPHYDHSEPAKGKSHKGMKDGGQASKQNENHENDEKMYGKGEGFTGSKLTIHEHEDGSYHTHAVSENGKEEHEEHEGLPEALQHAHEHFGGEGEHKMGHDGEEDGEGEKNVSMHHGGIGDSLKSLMG